MPTSSVETDIQNDLATILKAIGLSGFHADEVGKVRETPKVNEAIDVIPCVLICPRGRGPKGSESASFEGAKFRCYVEEIIVVMGREGDSKTPQPSTQLAYEQCIEAIQRQQSGDTHPGQDRLTLPTATSVYDITVGDIEGYDRSKLDEQYAYLSFFVMVRTSE